MGYWYFCADGCRGFFVKAGSMNEAYSILKSEVGDGSWACVNSLSPRAGRGRRIVPVEQSRQRVALLPPWTSVVPRVLVDVLNRYGFEVRI